MGDSAEKLTFLEELIQRLAYSQIQVNTSVAQFSKEMRDFKQEMREFKEEMREYKDKTDKQIQSYREETDRKIEKNREETDRQINRYKEETDRQINRYKEETDKQIQSYREETDRKIEKNREETDRQINRYKEETDKQIQSYREETDRKIEKNREETDRQIKADREKSDRELREMRIQWQKLWGDLANKMGTVVEDIVAPNIPVIAQKYFGCDAIDFLAIRIKKRSVKDKSRRKEFDAIAVCDDMVLLNETKSSPELRDVEKLAAFIERRELFDYFPEYEPCRIIPIFSSLYLDDAFISFATRKGIYVLTMKGDSMDIVNFDALSAKKQ